MALTYGALLMGKHKKADLEKIQKQARAEQKKARKRGLRSAIGGTLGSILAPAIMGGLGLSTGGLGLMAGKMVMSRLGRELGEETGPKVDTSAIGKDTHGFYKDIAKDYRTGLDDAKDALNQQQWMQSIMNPLQEYGMGKAGEQLKGWASGTQAGQKWGEFVDEGGLNLGEKLGDATKGLNIGENLGKVPGFNQLASLFKQVPLEERWDYEAPVDHIDPETGEPGVSY
tara:strand:- start:41 stop:724 length:684 start_codon:yes stop_codon:yes gene_type:complete